LFIEIIQEILTLLGVSNLTEREVRQEKNRKVLRSSKHSSKNSDEFLSFLNLAPLYSSDFEEL